MRVYSTRTSGSFVQRKGASISWNHQYADPEFGTMQARELQYHLQGVLAAFAVVVRAGKGYVEACPKGINKGVMAERIIELEQADDAHPYPPLTFPLSLHRLLSLPSPLTAEGTQKGVPIFLTTPCLLARAYTPALLTPTPYSPPTAPHTNLE